LSKTITTVAIDPGLRGSGVAIFINGQLQSAYYVEVDEMRERGPNVWRQSGAAVVASLTAANTNVTTLVLECPQVYPEHRSRSDDLIQLAGVVGSIATAVPARRVVGLYPREWTKRVPKEERHARLKKQLQPGEALRIQEASWKSLTHNVLDAVGLGLYYVVENGERW